MGRPKKSIDIEKTCEHCGDKFNVTEWEARRRDRKFCGLGCYYDHQTSLVDEAFFDEPNQQMAYVLGLIVTDGCIIKRKSGREFVSIKSIDRQVLEKVNEMMKSEYGIYECGISDGGNMVYRIDFASDKIVAGVKKWGVTARKTFTAVFPQLPRQFHADFIRGVFDGDGCISRWQDKGGGWTAEMCLLGTKKLLTPIKKFLGIGNKVHPYKRIFKVRTASLGNLSECYEKMYYADTVPCLERKKNKFQECLATLRDQREFYGKRSAENRKARKLAKMTEMMKQNITSAQ
jgi:hypothetical protein